MSAHVISTVQSGRRGGQRPVKQSNYGTTQWCQDFLNILGVPSKNLRYHFEYQASLIFLVSFPARQPPDRPRGLFETATPHLSPFSSGGRWCIPAGGSGLPGMHQECAPYPINRPYHGKASLGVISGLPRPFQAIGCHLRPHVCHICRKISEAWPI